jgi:hypothetical protein
VQATVTSLAHSRTRRRPQILLPALPIVREPILLALQVGVVVLLPIFVNLVATQLGPARVRLAFVRLVSATLELLEIPLTRLVAVFALGMPLSAGLIVALIFHRHLRRGNRKEA